MVFFSWAIWNWSVPVVVSVHVSLLVRPPLVNTPLCALQAFSLCAAASVPSPPVLLRPFFLQLHSLRWTSAAPAVDLPLGSLLSWGLYVMFCLAALLFRGQSSAAISLGYATASLSFYPFLLPGLRGLALSICPWWRLQ